MVIDTHAGFTTIFDRGLSIGLFFPIEAYSGDVPRMEGQENLARRAESLGFSALWFRDVPLRDPEFGDVGQIYDPWVYLAHIAAQTRRIALATGAIVLPVRHPLHVAKAAASVDVLSGNRLVLGLASGDRLREQRAFGVDPETRGARFRLHVELLRRAWSEHFPSWTSDVSSLDGLDPMPKPELGRVPILVAGMSQQTLEWIAEHADAWITYPRPPARQAEAIARWHEAVAAAKGGLSAPVAQSLYVDLLAERHASPRPIHLGWALGREPLVDLLGTLGRIGVSHVVLNLKYGRRPANEVVEELGEAVLPHFRRLASPERSPAPDGVARNAVEIAEDGQHVRDQRRSGEAVARRASSQMSGTVAAATRTSRSRIRAG
jgi:luciferase-type oxidoreductase